MATRIRGDAQQVIHDNYNANGTPATKAPVKRINFLLIENMDISNSIYVSFDNATYKTIKAGCSLSMDVDGMVSYLVKTGGSTVAVECLYGVEN